MQLFYNNVINNYVYSPAQHWPSSRNERLDGLLQLVIKLVEQVVRVEERDIPGGGGRGHVERGLLDAGRAVQGAGKGPH